MTLPKLFFRRCTGFCIGMAFASLGLALITNTQMGTTPITSLPFVLNLVLPFSVGCYTIIISVLFIFIEKLILGKDFTVVNMLQLPPVFLFGIFIDVFLKMTEGVLFLPYWERMIFLFLGIFALGAGINLQVVSNAVVLPGEGIVLAVAYRTQHNFGRIKVLIDSSLVAMSLLLSLLCLGMVAGIREGTVLSALLTGCCVRLLGLGFRKLIPFFSGTAEAAASSK